MPDTQDTVVKSAALTEDERDWLRDLPLDEALEKVQRNHVDERCSGCKRLIGDHSLRQLKTCLVKYWNDEERRD